MSKRKLVKIQSVFIFITVLIISSLQAQSFLSNQRESDVEIKNVLQSQEISQVDCGSDCVENESETIIKTEDSFDNDNIGTEVTVQEFYQKLSTPVSMEDFDALVKDDLTLESDINQIDSGDEKRDAEIEIDAETEIDSQTDVKIELNLDSLAKISIIINSGEFNLALATLDRFSNAVDENIEEEMQFYLKELYQFYLIEINFHLGNYEKVLVYANTYFEFYSNGDHYYQAFYYFSASLHYQEKPLEKVFMVTNDFFENLTYRQSSNFRKFLVQDSLNRKQYFTALGFLENINGELIQGFEKWTGNILKNIDNIEDIDIILERYSVDIIQSQSNLRKIQLLIRDGDYQQAQEYLDRLYVNGKIDDVMYGELHSLQNFINIALNTEPYKIGVILPFSHKSRKVRFLANQVLDGLELALRGFSRSDKPIQLVIKDSAYSNQQARLNLAQRDNLVKDLVRELVEEDRVIAILGPLAKNTSIAAGEMAESYKIPVISFSLTENIGKDFPFLFRFQRNPMEEAVALAKYAVSYLQAKRFVLFYNVDNTGKGFRVMQAFGNTVKENGGEIVGLSRINKRQADFKDSYLSFTGGFRKKSEEEIDELKRSGENSIKPVVDFDAMFVPVRPGTLKIISDFNRSFDAEKVWLLAGSEVNVQENQLLNYTRRLRFIDAFPISNLRTHLQPFFESHWKRFNYRRNYQAPTRYTIYAYEAFEILTALLNDPQYHNRESLRNAINKLDDFPVLTGKVSATENGELNKSLNILKIKNKNTVAVF